MTRERLSLVISRALGLLLLIAAGLKLHGVAIDPAAAVGLFSTPSFQLAIIVIEIGLAIWLLSGRYPIGAWLSSIATFTAFAGVSFYLGWIGQPKCGCLGKVNVNPWESFAMDIVAMILLLVARPNLRVTSKEQEDARVRAIVGLGKMLASVSAILGVFALVTSLWFGSPDAALAGLRGDQLSVESRVIELGSLDAGAEVIVPVSLINHTAIPIRVVGGTSDCACIATEDLPLVIPAP